MAQGPAPPRRPLGRYLRPAAAGLVAGGVLLLAWRLTRRSETDRPPKIHGA